MSLTTNGHTSPPTLTKDHISRGKTCLVQCIYNDSCCYNVVQWLYYHHNIYIQNMLSMNINELIHHECVLVCPEDGALWSQRLDRAIGKSIRSRKLQVYPVNSGDCFVPFAWSTAEGGGDWPSGQEMAQSLWRQSTHPDQIDSHNGATKRRSKLEAREFDLWTHLRTATPDEHYRVQTACACHWTRWPK